MATPEKPILFSAPMVSAILDGRKTQTRRVVQPQPERGTDCPYHIGDGSTRRARACPYGKTGDRLWVRETCRAEEMDSGLDGVRYLADGAFIPIQNTQRAADQWIAMSNYRNSHGATVPSIHMPRWASRITLVVTGTRIERLQDISKEDAKAEGFAKITKDNGLTWKHGIPDLDGLPGNDDNGWPWKDWHADPRAAFRHLWQSINGHDSWNDSPWVWVVEFEVRP